MQGWFSLAKPNIYLMTLADSPIYLSTMAEATTFKNLASIFEARALAIKVFPVPGGPYMRQPFGGLIPTLLKSSGFVMGNSIVYLRILSWSPNPPISEKSTLPGSSFIMLKTKGSTSLGRICMIVRVVWSRATLAPTTNFDRSILTLTPTTFRVPVEDLTISTNRTYFTLLFGNFFENLPDDLAYRLEGFELIISFLDFFSLIPKIKSFWIRS